MFPVPPQLPARCRRSEAGGFPPSFPGRRLGLGRRRRRRRAQPPGRCGARERGAGWHRRYVTPAGWRRGAARRPRPARPGSGRATSAGRRGAALPAGRPTARSLARSSSGPRNRPGERRRGGRRGSARSESGSVRAGKGGGRGAAEGRCEAAGPGPRAARRQQVETKAARCAGCP